MLIRKGYAMAYEELLEQAKKGYPESWIPKKEGDAIAGRLVKVDRATTAYGPCKIAILETEDGNQHGVWLLHTTLVSQFDSANPQIGDAVAVLYKGKVKSKEAGHSDYHSYRVVTDGSTKGDIEWASEKEYANENPLDDLPFE